MTSWYDNAICVAGTRQTTTTSMVRRSCSLPAGPAAFIGGKLPCIRGGGRGGSATS
ncbi:MAG: hypothetical protein ACLR5S_09900 [Ruminococcus sp.]